MNISIDKREAAIQNLNEELKGPIEIYKNLMVKKEAEMAVYLGGVRDSIRLMLKINEIEKEKDNKAGQKYL